MIKRIFYIYKDSFSGLSRDIWLLSLIMVINRTGSMVLTFMSLYLTSELGFSLTDAGWVMGAYGLGSVAGSYVGGFLTDRLGFYYVQLYSLIFSAFLLIILIFLTNYYVILTSLFFFSLISDALRPANSVAVAAYSTPENRTRSFSLMRFAINLGFSIGPALGGIIAGWFGFKWIFLFDAVTCLFAAALLIKYLKVQDQPRLKIEEKPEMKSLSAYRDKEYLIFIFLVSLYAIAFFQLFTSVPVFWAKEWGFNTEKIGILLALNGLIVVVAEMPFIRATEHFQRFWKLISAGCFLLICSFVCLIFGWASIIPAILFIIMISLSEIFAMPFMTNYAISRPPDERRGQYMALYAMAYGIAHIVAPMGSMFIADNFGFITLYLSISVLSLMVGIGFLIKLRAR